MNKSQEILSDVTIFNKYAKHIPELGRRETWDELCERNMAMHIRKYPMLKEEIKNVYAEFVATKKVLPSMRSLQFGGSPIELANNRVFNCAFTNMDAPECFSETMFNLLGGSGVGFSVQSRHTNLLPVVEGVTSRKRRFLVGDSIEGWADAVKVLVKAYYFGKSDPDFDFRDIRPKGARLVTSGGKAPGPDPLRVCLDRIRSVFNNAIGRRLKPLEVHDIQCFIADAVLSGGIRRAALISLFDVDDMDMLSCKSGAWWELNPQRGRANNSVVLHREYTTKEQFDFVWKRVQESGAGEPGIFWTNDYDWGTNPCAEIALKSNSYCNLTEINASDVVDQEDLDRRAEAGAFLGTLQAGYTDFHYLREIWKDNSDEMALLGVGMTGIAGGSVLKLDLAKAAHCAVTENKRVASVIGIKPAHRVTTVKPSGTSSLVMGCSSGIHAWHSNYYVRRMRVGKNEALYSYMKEKFPTLVEDCHFKPHLEAVMSFPQRAPEGALTRSESYMDLLERVKKFNLEWVREGHNEGKNSHNVSCTISLKEEDWVGCGVWMWDNRASYTGISVLPFDNGTYIQAPFTDSDRGEYEALEKEMNDIDLTQVREEDDNTALNEQVACAGGACLID